MEQPPGRSTLGISGKGLVVFFASIFFFMGAYAAPPPGRWIAARALAASRSEPSPAPPQVHTVKRGDTLWSIAAANGIDVDELISANSITDPDRLQIGQKIVIPSTASVSYTVKRGDTLWSISRRFGVSLESIISVNELADPNAIKEGQELLIPRSRSGADRRENTADPDRLTASRTLGSTSRGPALRWPAEGRVTSPFGSRWGRIHEGIDISVPAGTPIRAAAAGEVIYAGWSNGYGRIVIIDHGRGVRTRYGHASRLLVSTGDSVQAGQVIALVGSSGNATGPHLHFEVRVDGKPQDPMIWLP